MNTADDIPRRRQVPTTAAVFDDDAILVEMVHAPAAKRSAFVVWKDGAWSTESYVENDGVRFAPYAPHNNLLRNDVVLFPSEPIEYGTEPALLAELLAFIHRYVDLSPLFEKIAAYYVLLSWVYDGFNELPYLRVRGDPGSGKTRFLLVVGSLVYKPIFASGASTVSPIFRMLDAIRGTLVIDESDFQQTDERAEIVKIFNNGNAKGFPVLRSEVSSKGEYNPRAYSVYGPKIIATRGPFDDRALESRCLTEEMGGRGVRSDIPINLPESYKDEALTLRNKLLLFRFRNRSRRAPTEDLVDRSIEPRLNQIFAPLLTIIGDETARAEIRDLARQYNREMITERGMDTEAHVLEIIRDLTVSYGQRISIKDITRLFIERYALEYDRRITTKWIGYVVRRRLRLATHKSQGNFVIDHDELPKLERLYERYGITTDAEDIPSPYSWEDFGDVGDVGTGAGA